MEKGLLPEKHMGTIKERERLFTYGVFAATIIFILLLIHVFSQNIPFYFEDIPVIQNSTSQSSHKLIADILNPFSVGGEYMDRPVEWLSLKALHDFAGLNPMPYHWFKNLCLLLVVFLSMAWVQHATGSVLFASLSGLLIAAANPIYQSTLWVADFEMVAQVFIIISLGLWFLLLSEEVRSKFGVGLTSVLIVLLGYLGAKTKGSSLVIAPAVFLSAIPFGLRKTAYAALLALPLILATVATRLLMAQDVMQEKVVWDNVPSFFNQTFITIGHVPFFAGIAVCLLLISRVSPLWKRFVDRWGLEKAEKTRAAAAVLTAWVFSACMLWLVFPFPETRFLAGFMIPAICMICLVLGLIAGTISNKIIKLSAQTIFTLGIVYLLIVNIQLNIHFRGSWGSIFIAVDRASRYIENSFENTLVMYDYWRPMFYVTKPERNNVFSRPQDGTFTIPDRFERFVLLSFYSPKWYRPTLKKIDGDAGGWFEKMVDMLDLEIRDLIVQSMETRQGINIYPCKIYFDVTAGDLSQIVLPALM
jgi:hypothetical protein